jgi:trk system potassium uptake protein TrkH
MNYKRIARLIGILLAVLAASMLTSIPWALHYEEPSTVWAFVYSAAITAAVGGAAWWFGHRDKGTIFRSEAVLVVGASWLLLGIFGGLPYLFDGVFDSPVDAYFEAISGFTTTGSTVMTDIAAHSMGLHWWRSLTQWLGGMGIIVLFVAIFPQLGVGGKFLFKSEVPGPITEGLKPKIKSTASTLWWLYVGLTVIVALLLKATGMTWHDAWAHAFTTLSTGGFSPKAGSVAEFDSATVDYIITIFMVLAGINFGLYYAAIRGRVAASLQDRELWAYLGLIGVATLLVTLSIYDDVHATILDSFRYGIFQVVGIVTTTGFGTDNFDLYPPLAKLLLVMLMFVGGMAGSTAGGLKVFRIIVVIKAIYVEIYKTFRPQSVMAVRVGRSVIPRKTVMAIMGFFAVGLLIFALSSLYLAALGLDIVTATSAVAATLFNIGPGLARVGSVESFAFIPDSGKVLLSLCMILGRLEFMTILVLLLPEFWKR